MCICAIEKYRNWLMPSDPSTNHKNAFAKHQVGTGSWLLENSKYKDWKKEQNSLMWIHGICESISTGIICLFSCHHSWCRKNNSLVS